MVSIAWINKSSYLHMNEEQRRYGRKDDKNQISQYKNFFGDKSQNKEVDGFLMNCHPSCLEIIVESSAPFVVEICRKKKLEENPKILVKRF